MKPAVSQSHLYFIASLCQKFRYITGIIEHSPVISGKSRLQKFLPHPLPVYFQVIKTKSADIYGCTFRSFRQAENPSKNRSDIFRTRFKHNPFGLPFFHTSLLYFISGYSRK